MTQPTPAQLRRYARELRELAREQRANADRTEALLTGVTALTDTSTWQGTYPTDVNGEVDGWVRSLQSSAHEMRLEARGWEHAADDADDAARSADAG